MGAVELVENDEDARVGNLGEQIADLRHRERARRQQIRERTAALDLRGGRGIIRMVEQRNILGDGAHHLAEIGFLAAGRIADDIARILRQLRQYVQQRSLADTAIAIEHDMQPLVLDRADQGAQHLGPPGEHLVGQNRL
jgi:hypothetical protein